MDSETCICFERMRALTRHDGLVVQVNPPGDAPGRRACPLGCGTTYRVWTVIGRRRVGTSWSSRLVPA